MNCNRNEKPFPGATGCLTARFISAADFIAVLALLFSSGYDAANAVPLDLKLVEDKGPAGFVFQTVPADPKRRGIYGHFAPPCNVT